MLAQPRWRYPHDAGWNRVSMRERIVVKWGGGLITEKSTLKTVNSQAIEQLALELHDVVNNGVDVVLVHGAGSFGHLQAKRYRLAEGRQHGDIEGPMTQDEAVVAVQQDMLELNDHVMAALTAHEISAVRLPPHDWVHGTGLDFEANFDLFTSAPNGIVMVTFGDVVTRDPPHDFGILSGDDLVARLVMELGNIRRLVFAMGGVDGVLKSAPVEGQPQELIEVMTPSTLYDGEHAAEMDVTGGIGLKIQRGFEAANHGCEVLLISGEVPGRFSSACMGLPVVGTRLMTS